MEKNQKEKIQSETIEENANDILEEQPDAQSSIQEEVDSAVEEADGLREQLSKSEDECKGLIDKLQRLAAEFDNYKRRTTREKDNMYTLATVDVVSSFLPVLDNLERALLVTEENKDADDRCIREGVQMVYRQFYDVLTKLDVKPINAKGATFNPELHEAVMHIEDDNYGENEIIEEFQKGYIYKDEVIIRHSMVKVAN